jgi:hypothetical protein
MEAWKEMIGEASQQFLLWLKINQLNKRNYTTWSIRIQIALSKAGCKKIVFGQEARPTPSTENAAVVENWDKRNKFALTESR